MKYRIEWISKFTAARGFGPAEFTEVQAGRIVKALNNQNSPCLHHATPIQLPTTETDKEKD